MKINIPMKKVSIYTKLIVTEIIAILIFYKLKLNINFDWISQILGISAFLFGLIIAFTISNRHNRLDEIRDKLREQDAVLLSIFYLSRRFSKSISNHLKKLIDEMLITQIDYDLIDFDIENPKKLRSLYNYIEDIKVNNKSQIEAHEKMLDAINNLLKIHEALAYRVKNKMRAYEWISLLLLGGITFFCFIALNNQSIESVLILSIFTSAIALLFFILKEIESLEWQESEWIWGPLANLFEELELLPYFPEDVIDKQRVKVSNLTNSKKIRIANYPFPYPNMKNKKISIISIKEGLPKK